MSPKYHDFSKALSVRSKPAAISLHANLPDYKRAGSILDLGFGDGTLIKELSRLRPHWKICGFDPNPVLLDEQKKSLPQADLRVADGLEALAINPRKFDLIIASHFFYYFTMRSLPKMHELLFSRLTPTGQVAVGMVSNCSDIYSPYSILTAREKYLPQGAGGLQLMFAEDYFEAFPAYSKKWEIRYDLQMNEPELAEFYRFTNRLADLSESDERFIAQLSGKNNVAMLDVWAIYER